MHWSDTVAEEIIQRNPDQEEYVCAAGISPSGSVHIGNFRDVATSFFVARALGRRGKKARLVFSWDEFDRLRKVPANVAEVTDGFEKYIGYPYVDVPNPFGTKEPDYATYFEKEFEEAIDRFGIGLDYRYQAKQYRAGCYREHIIRAMDRREEIFDILDTFRTQEAAEGERQAYYPISIYCGKCHRDTTKILSYDNVGKKAEYVCQCGHSGTFDLQTDTDCKLAWKIDWPMRWMYEKVDFEPGGKDHAAPGGSYHTSRVIAERIFGIRAPVFVGYEFIGIRGMTGKMSGSSGLQMTPGTLLKIYQPEILLWLYARVEANKAFDLCFDEGILRQYFEFDRQYGQYIRGEADDRVISVMESCLLDRGIKTVPMALLVQLGSIVDFNVPMLETVFRKIGHSYRAEDFGERLGLAKYWLEHCSPENVNRLVPHRNWAVYDSLSGEQRREIALLHDFLAKENCPLEALNNRLYEITRDVYGAQYPQIKKRQGEFFKTVYRLLLNKETGPRLYLFLSAVEKERLLKLLDFSCERTEEERNPV